ncbi:SMI1/KNR4 family protein [Methylocaldum sp. MU1018]
MKKAEQRLGVRFPRSYRDFLSVSNGWLTDQEIFLPVEKVGRLQDEDPGLVTDWYGGIASNISDEDYFQYDLSKQYPIHIRVQYLPDCLLLSEHYGISSRWYLLNPAIRFDDGEWEAWRVETRIAGARRFRRSKP